MMETKCCTRCQIKSEGELLKEIGYREDLTLTDIARQAQHDQETYLGQRSAEHAKQRLLKMRQRLQSVERQLKELKENALYEAMDFIQQGIKLDEIAKHIIDDDITKQLEIQQDSLRWGSRNITEQDIRNVLDEYERQGHLEVNENIVRITSAGVRRLASNALETILQNLGHETLGTHSVEQSGSGSELSVYTRDYEAGDDYSLVNIEQTVINALERDGHLNLDTDDFVVHEEIHQSRLCAGLLIDKSLSMRRNNKLEAAIETALALSELIRREPRDILKIFVFSEQVKEIPAWSITREIPGGNLTDIKGAMQAYLSSVRSIRGDKQVYLITDNEPNYEDDKYVGFGTASAGVMKEALRYRNHNIGLDIIMLDDTPQLKQLASTMARQNLGRVFFTNPHNLGQAIVSDYLRTKRRTN